MSKMPKHGSIRPFTEGTKDKALCVPMAAFACTAMLALSGCHHQKTVAYQPPPPAIDSQSGYGYSHHTTAATEPSIDLRKEVAKAPSGFFDDTSGRPVFTEVGNASWYGTVYHHHAAADGTTFDQNDMTAAHRTLPLGSTARITNLATGQQVLVRITDRGPFSPGRVLDLSMGAAKAVGIYRAGIAKVRIEAFSHSSADPAGKWCVQTGGFKSQNDAMKLKEKLLRRYRTAKVVEFAGPTGYWVRIDPSLRSKTQANEIAEWIGAPDPATLPYVVRVD